MGWAARANPIAQARRRREIKPLAKVRRETPSYTYTKRLWAAFDARLAAALKSKKKDAA